MFNVAVVNVKDLIKYLVGFICIFCLLVFFTRYFFVDNNQIKNMISAKINFFNELEKLIKNNNIKVIDYELPIYKENSDNTNLEIKESKETAAKSINERMLQIELMEIEEKVQEFNNIEEQFVNAEISVQEENNGINTEIVTQNPIIATPTDIYKNVQIRNQTGYVLSQDILTPNIEVNTSNIIIFHTHTCESYTQTEQNRYEPSGTFRTTDTNYSVAKVGDELNNYLKEYGFNVVHNKTLHDYPAYTGSYARSLKTIEQLMKTNPSDIVIDIHRDAIGSNSQYAPTVKIGEDYVAQLMFVIGTDGGGLWHPNWNKNLKFAVKVQEKAEELYPGLFKPIIVRNSRYNQHVAKAAVIIEVGATGNTLEQSLTSMKYLSKVLNDIIKK